MTKLEASIRDFEKKLNEALKDKYSSSPSEHQQLMIKSNVITRFDILAFYKAYLKSSNPKEWLEPLIHALFDIKLQLFYIGEFDMGLYNLVLYLRGYDSKNPTTLETLKKMSLDQNVIVKSRILWERMINFVSIYLTGEEVSSSSRKSKKGKFSKIIKNTPWEFLNDYWKTLEWFDDHLRTPEVHTGSVLRKYFIKTSSDIDENKILVLYNIAINLFYPNIMNIVNGEEPGYGVWAIGMVEQMPIAAKNNPKPLE